MMCIFNGTWHLISDHVLDLTYHGYVPQNYKNFMSTYKITENNWNIKVLNRRTSVMLLFLSLLQILLCCPNCNVYENLVFHLMNISCKNCTSAGCTWDVIFFYAKLYSVFVTDVLPLFSNKDRSPWNVIGDIVLSRNQLRSSHTIICLFWVSVHPLSNRNRNYIFRRTSKKKRTSVMIKTFSSGTPSCFDGEGAFYLWLSSRGAACHFWSGLRFVRSFWTMQFTENQANN